jgi:hypothetical protein
MSFARRTDANHAELKGYFERLGCSVHDASRLGEDFPDLIVALHKQTVLVEVKSENGKLTPGQIRFRREWKGITYEARTLDDVIAIVGELKKNMRFLH